MRLSATIRLYRRTEEGPVPVDRPDLGPCLLWTGHVRGDGYAKIRLGGRGEGDEYVHRVAYRDQAGLIPDGYEVDHLCKVRHCVRGIHLEAVTSEEHAARRRQDKCRKGLHQMEGANVIITTQGTRGCRTCKNARSAERYRELLCQN